MKMEPTISFVISRCRVLLADKPPDVQIKFLWLLLETLAADIDQIKAFIGALNTGTLHYINVVKTYPAEHTEQANRLQADMTKLMKELAQSINERGGERS